jgi:hypothetical protein
LIANNTDHILSFANIPFKIISNEGKTFYKSQLTDKYEVESKTFSVFKIIVEAESDFNIPLNEYQIIFSN